MKPVRIGIAGASGRMGRKLLEAVCRLQSKRILVKNFKEVKVVAALELTAALEHAGHPILGTDAALLTGKVGAFKKPVLLSDTFDPKSVDVFIDFSTPAAAVALSQQCRKHKIPMVVGVTGFSKAEKKELEAASVDIPLLMSPNMSDGVISMFDIVRQAASLFDDSDVEICETHHRHKKDAPSGTALRLGEIVAKERDVSFNDAAVFDRQRQGNVRGDNEIGFSSIRGGDIIGEHRVIFASNGEQIEIIHRTTDRITYAIGAINAAKRIIRMSPGLYSMEDIFTMKIKKLNLAAKKLIRKPR